jgi:hypothetical protein
MVYEDSSQELKRPERETDNKTIEWVARGVCVLYKDTQLKTTKPEGTRPLESDRSMRQDNIEVYITDKGEREYTGLNLLKIWRNGEQL